jgi:N-acetyl-anhydromuramyl-L-alanine amidase AmpD
MTIKPLVHWLASRGRSRPCDTVVLHATAGSTFAGALSALKARELSYHYVIEDQRESDGLVRKCVPYGRVAFHAGKSEGPHGANVNSYSVGISFVNLNDGLDGYSLKQYAACLELIQSLKTALPLKYITTHAFISPGRKTDPREFPIEQMAHDCGLELWGGSRLGVVVSGAEGGRTFRRQA